MDKLGRRVEQTAEENKDVERLDARETFEKCHQLKPNLPMLEGNIGESCKANVPGKDKRDGVVQKPSSEIYLRFNKHCSEKRSKWILEACRKKRKSRSKNVPGKIYDICCNSDGLTFSHFKKNSYFLRFLSPYTTDELSDDADSDSSDEDADPIFTTCVEFWVAEEITRAMFASGIATNMILDEHARIMLRRLVCLEEHELVTEWEMAKRAYARRGLDWKKSSRMVRLCDEIAEQLLQLERVKSAFCSFEEILEIKNNSDMIDLTEGLYNKEERTGRRAEYKKAYDKAMADLNEALNKLLLGAANTKTVEEAIELLKKAK